MEASHGSQKQRPHEFPGVSVSNVSCSSDAPSPSTATLRFVPDESGGSPQLQFHREADVGFVVCVDVRTSQLFRLGPGESLCVSERSRCTKEKENSYSSAITLRFRSDSERKAFHCAFEEWKNEVAGASTGSQLENGTLTVLKNKFDDKIEAASAKMYFHYYGQLLHQQNMLQDYVRTGTYYAAVIENRADFLGRVVVDVGAGSGILSLFAAQAGAKHVYAVEASEMAEYAHKLISGNPSLGERITVVKGKVEEAVLPEKADVLISEPMGYFLNPRYQYSDNVHNDSEVRACILDVIRRLARNVDEMIEAEREMEPYRLRLGTYGEREMQDAIMRLSPGTLLVNERMLESYVIARDRFLVPNGKMFPTLGRIHMAPFSDEYLYVEIANKALFWQQRNYFGVDLNPLHGSAFQGYFSQPVVDAFDPRLLISPAVCHTLDFTCIKEEELYEIDIPFSFTASVGTRVHGLACWFDVLFNGSSVQRWLTTAPGAPTTHWYQLRCVLSQPLYVMAGQEITGHLRMVAHNAQSYTLYLTMSAKMWGVGADLGGILQTSSCKLDLKEPYYRMSQPQAYAWAQDQQSQQLLNPQGISIQSQNIDGIMQSPAHPGVLANQ